MHCLILGIQGVDHINGDTLDNRRHNLRSATASQNAMNRKKRSGSYYSKFIGVTRHQGKWTGSVTKDGKSHNAGRFDNEEECARARDKLALKLHGEFAVLNFPEETWTT